MNNMLIGKDRESSQDLRPTRRASSNYGMLRAEEIVFSKEEHNNGLSSFK